MYYPKQLSRQFRVAGGGAVITENATAANARDHLRLEQVGFTDASGFSLLRTFPRTVKLAGFTLVASHPQAYHNYIQAGYTDPGADIA